jgi:ribosomal protein L20A (L18A)
MKSEAVRRSNGHMQPARRLVEATGQASSALRRLRAFEKIRRAKEECHLLERVHRTLANRRAVKRRIMAA